MTTATARRGLTPAARVTAAPQPDRSLCRGCGTARRLRRDGLVPRHYLSTAKGRTLCPGSDSQPAVIVPSRPAVIGTEADRLQGQAAPVVDLAAALAATFRPAPVVHPAADQAALADAQAGLGPDARIGRIALAEKVRELSELAPALDRYLLAADPALDDTDPATVDQLVAWVERMSAARKHVAQVEQLMLLRAAAIHRRSSPVDAPPREGVLPDGRPWKLSRGADRKAWDHPAWQTAVRRQVLSGVDVEQVVDAGTGERVDVVGLMVAVEGVHGSGPPRTGKLKALGIDPGEFCETSPGLWGLRITEPGQTTTDDE